MNLQLGNFLIIEFIYKRVLVGGNQKNYNKLSFIIHNVRLPPKNTWNFLFYRDRINLKVFIFSFYLLR